MHAKSDVGERVCRLVDQGRGAYLWGEPGRGKTYAAAQAVRVAVERSHGGATPAKLVSAKHLLDSIREGFNGGDRDALRRAERVPLLALDDLGAGARPTGPSRRCTRAMTPEPPKGCQLSSRATTASASCASCGAVCPARASPLGSAERASA
ncbi:MAG: hypothetical protein ACLTSX_12585 [Collinsella sp.]